MSIQITSPISGPHAHRRASVQRTMMWVMLALTPATLFGFQTFSWPAINLFLVTCTTALVTEAACLHLARKRLRPMLMDGSALLTGWLLAVSLPPWAPWWIGAVGGFIAVLVGKQVFGGIGQNVFNPAMVGRVVLLISFPLQMTRFHAPSPLFGGESGFAQSFLDGLAVTFLGQVPGSGSGLDSVASASVLGHVKTELGRGQTLSDILPGTSSSLDLATGWVTGSMGETSAILLLAGGIFLIGMRIITWHIPVAMLGTLAALATIMHLADPSHFPGPELHLLGGGALLGAFFIATDPVTAPVSNLGRLVYGAALGLLLYVIRTWTGYPEGLAFAILLLNACAPLIDRATRPRILGRDHSGAPFVHDPAKLGARHDG